MTPLWQRDIKATRLAFVNELTRLGFVEITDNTNAGSTVLGEPSTLAACGLDIGDAIRIHVGADFPFTPPDVKYKNPPAQLTWHLQSGGTLCLWHRGNHSRLEWLTPLNLIERIGLWWADRDKDWPHDAGALDLQHYFPGGGSTLYTYASPDDLQGQVTLENKGNGWYHWTKYTPTGGRDDQFLKRQLRRTFAESVDLGTLQQPVWNWPTIAARLDPETAKRIENGIQRKSTGHLMLRYTRPGPEGDEAAILGVTAMADDNQIKLEAVYTAEDSQRVLGHRAGTDAPALKTKSCLIVGLGAIGSFVADGLARSGIGKLTVMDHDIMLPGNSTRHLCGPETINLSKPDAVEASLTSRGLMDRSTVAKRHERMTARVAFELLSKHDVVVDATADLGVEWALQTIGHDLHTPIIHVRLHRQGGLCRIDRSHPQSTDRMADVPPRDDEPAPTREPGCIDTISPTPPWAAQAAASRAVAAVIDVLTDRWEHPDSYIDVLIPQPDPPYDTLGALTNEAT